MEKEIKVVPKYNITSKLTVVKTYESTEIEADTQDEAESMVQEMISDEELSIESEDETFEHKVESIAE